MSADPNTSKPTVGYLELIRRNDKFRYLWMGMVVSLLGDWFNLIASASLVAVLTDSGAAIGSLFVVRMLGPFFISPFAGVIADRYNRKHILIATDIIRGVLVLGFLFVRRPEDVWIIYAITGVQMAMAGIFFPTRSAILPDITEPHELGAANAITSATWSVMLAFGAALGGFSSGIFGIYPSFVLDSITFFVSAFILAQMMYTQPVALEGGKTISAALGQYVDGLRYLRHHADVFVITLHKAANSLFINGAWQVIIVPISEIHFPMGEGSGISLGLIYACSGVGTGIGPIIGRYFTGDDDRALRKAIIIGYIISASGVLLASTLASFPIVLIGALLRGTGGGIVWVFSAQLLLQIVPGDVRGRVFSTEWAIFNLMNAIAAGSGGFLVDSMGITTMLQWMGSLVLIPAFLWALWIFFGGGRESKLAAVEAA